MFIGLLGSYSSNIYTTIMLRFAVTLLGIVLVTANDVILQQVHEKMTLLAHRLDVTETENARLKQELNDLKNNARRRQIPYSEEVGFTAEISQHLNHLGSRHTIVFDRVISNIGNAYDPITGYFIAPISGTYMFFSNIMSEGLQGTHTYIETEIVTGNGTQLAEMYSGSLGAYDSTSNMAIIRLQRGDHVWVRVHGSWSNNFSIHCCFSSFSGYLLKIDEGRVEIIG